MIYDIYIGSYGLENESGITLLSLDTDKGVFERKYTYEGIFHPSYLCLNREKRVMYVVQEKIPEGSVFTLRISENGLRSIKEESSRGADPCHLCMDRSGRTLYVSNYTSGSLAVYYLDENGVPSGMSDFVQHLGRGINSVRQECAHVHFSQEHEGKLFVSDLGLDQIFIYNQDVEHGRIADSGKRILLPLGSGPRHLEFHPTLKDVVYVICELSSQVAVFREQNDNYRMIQLLSAVPTGFQGENIAAAIHVSGQFLMVSNRGHDSISVFRVRQDGLLEFMDNCLTGGKTPRDFAVLDDIVVAANQDSDSLTVMNINRETGKLSKTGIYMEILRPCCVCGVDF